MWVAEAGGAVDANVILKSSLEGASKGAGRSEDSEFVCWYYERERVTQNIRMSQEAEGPRHGTVERFEDGRQRRKEQEEVPVQNGLGMNSREVSAFEARKRSLAES